MDWYLNEKYCKMKKSVAKGRTEGAITQNSMTTQRTKSTPGIIRSYSGDDGERGPSNILRIVNLASPQNMHMNSHCARAPGRRSRAGMEIKLWVRMTLMKNTVVLGMERARRVTARRGLSIMSFKAVNTEPESATVYTLTIW